MKRKLLAIALSPVLISSLVTPVKAANRLELKQSREILVAHLSLIETPWWQDEVKYQVFLTQNQQLNACLFGDSLSSWLWNTLGKNNFNFSLSEMSTISLTEQLKILHNAKVRCNHAIIAIGTNDASYPTMTGEQFFLNLKNIIMQVRSMGATRITLIPAFYSTLAAINKHYAGTVARIEEMNYLIRLIGVSENVIVAETAIQPLFTQQSLKSNFTLDGVHLNADGKKLYRESLLKIIGE